MKYGIVVLTLALSASAAGQGIWTITDAGHSSIVTSVAFSPDGTLLASGSADKTIRLWEVATGKELRRFKESIPSSILSLAFSPNGSQLASGSSGGRTCLWNVARGQELWCFEGPTKVFSVAFSPDGALLATGIDTRGVDHTIRTFIVATGQEVRHFGGNSHTVYSLVFSPDGTQIASGSNNGTLSLWDVATGQEVRRFKGHTHHVYSVVFSPDGSQLVSGAHDWSLRLWDVATGLEVRRIRSHTAWIGSVVFSPDDTQLATGSHDNTVRLWDVITGQEVRRFEGHTHRVHSVAFSPDGTQLASGSWDDSIRLWDIATGQDAQRFEGHSGYVTSVVFSPDGAQLVSGSQAVMITFRRHDNTIRLWDIATGREIDRLGSEYPIYSIAISGNERFIASAGATAIRLWDAKATALETVPSSILEIPVTFTHYPNPAGAYATVEYALSEVSRVQLSVHDLLGREVLSVLDATQAPGSHSLQLATGHLSGGMYFLRLITDDKQMKRPLIVH